MYDEKPSPEPRQISEKTRLKQEAKYLRRQIKQAQNLLNQRKKVQTQRALLEDLQYQIKHPGTTGY
jgi:hypothetical protein